MGPTENYYDILCDILKNFNSAKKEIEKRSRENMYDCMLRLVKNYTVNTITPEVNNESKRRAIKGVPAEEIAIENILMDENFKDGALFCLWFLSEAVLSGLPEEFLKKIKGNGNDFWGYYYNCA